jgi:hypothetical protein
MNAQGRNVALKGEHVNDVIANNQIADRSPSSIIIVLDFL